MTNHNGGTMTKKIADGVLATLSVMERAALAGLLAGKAQIEARVRALRDESRKMAEMQLAIDRDLNQVWEEVKARAGLDQGLTLDGLALSKEGELSRVAERAS